MYVWILVIVVYWFLFWKYFLYKMFYENINVIFVFLVNCGLFLKIKWVIIFKGYSFEGLICIYMC